MKDRVREKEKAELLPYKENAQAGQVRALVDTRSREPGLRDMVSIRAELSISAVQPWESTHQLSAHSNPQHFIYKREKKPEDKGRESYPRRAEQLNFFSSGTEKWGADVPP